MIQESENNHNFPHVMYALPAEVTPTGLRDRPAYLHKAAPLKVAVKNKMQTKLPGEKSQFFLIPAERGFTFVKYAQVQQACMSVGRHKYQVRVTAWDQNRGFDPENEERTNTKEGKFGIFDIMERINLPFGSLDIYSQSGDGEKAVLLSSKDNNGTEATDVQEVKENKPSNNKIKVLLVDDHLMMREGLRKIIEEEGDLTVIAEASSGEEAVQLTRDVSPDVIVMDVNMPGMNGIEATRRINKENQNIRIIGLSLHDSSNVAQSMKSAGASAYLTKTEATQALCETIRNM